MSISISRFNITLASGYKSLSQQIRVLSEDWVAREGYCPSCGRPLTRAQRNRPVLDFSCLHCLEDFELKSKKDRMATKLVDGAYRTMLERLNSDSNPSLFLLNYQPLTLEVMNFVVIPKHFFIDDMIERRRPLSAGARRAGWTGCNILLNRVPQAGRIFIVRDNMATPHQEVLGAWKQTLFLRGESLQMKGWILSILKCIDSIQKPEFRLDEMYAFENDLKQEYPNNRHIKDKIRQQMQYLRNYGYLEFLGRGKYRKISREMANTVI
ncbi:MAG: restriction endonuclease [Candidatus Omnitrophica bacterium]|nr:restriction endonuclease [Candidatus Omnitrophota bacterium]